MVYNDVRVSLSPFQLVNSWNTIVYQDILSKYKQSIFSIYHHIRKYDIIKTYFIPYINQYFSIPLKRDKMSKTKAFIPH